MAKKEKKEEEAADWMGTYGDMVTLLLCFFVLMYAMSSMDEGKWEIIVRAFNSDALTLQDTATGSQEQEEEVGGETELIPELTVEVVEEALETLFIMLSAAVAESNNESEVSVTKGDGFVFISFNDAVFFDGDSYVVRDEGKSILDLVIGPLDIAAPYIDEVRVMGHTAQARADELNEPTADRFLASARSATVLVYVQQNSTALDPARLISVGYGQWRPIDTNSTVEGRGNNRRVEMMISGVDVEDVLGDSISQYEMLRD